MKLKYLTLSLLGVLALATVNAQEVMDRPAADQKPARKTAFEKLNGYWFVTLQGGVGSHFWSTSEDKYAVEKRRIKQYYSLSIGKEHNPYFATRLQINGAEAPLFYGKGDADVYKASFIGAHYDFMFDVVDFFARYKEDRVFHLIPFVGLGYQYRFMNKFEDPHHAATANAGIQINFRLGKCVDLVLEGQGIYSNFSFSDKKWTPKAYNGLYTAVTGGLNFRLGRTEWKEVVPMDEQLLEGLNNQINSLRRENAELSKRPVSCPECPEPMDVVDQVIEVVNELSEKAILFRFDSAVIDASQKINLYYISEFVKKNNTPIVIIGHADQTGGKSYNQKLSERRAKAVAKALVREFGVSEDLISTEWVGATDQFNPRAWNRVVIVRSK